MDDPLILISLSCGMFLTIWMTRRLRWTNRTEVYEDPDWYPPRIVVWTKIDNPILYRFGQLMIVVVLGIGLVTLAIGLLLILRRLGAIA